MLRSVSALQPEGQLPSNVGHARGAEQGAFDRDTRSEALLGGGPTLGERQRAALEALRGGAATAAELGRASGCSHASLRSLAEQGLIRSDIDVFPLDRVAEAYEALDHGGLRGRAVVTPT